MDGVLNGTPPADRRPGGGEGRGGYSADPAAAGALDIYSQAIINADDNEERPDIVKPDGSVERQPFVYAYDEIRNALWIENNPVYRAALKEWDRKEKYLGKRVDRREQSAVEFTNQMYQIVGFFCVFQGIVVSTVPNLTPGNYPCGKIWFPIVLSVLAALVSIIGVWNMFENLRALEFSIHSEKQAHQEAASRAASLRREGARFKFHQYAKEPMLRPLKSKIWINRIGVILSLILFTVIFIVSYFVILCDVLVIGKGKHGV